jgi:hypothetical protein
MQPQIEAAQKKEMGEMVDKLKGLGNSILGKHCPRAIGKTMSFKNRQGNFGLSVDNFKFEPNGQGGYSMNFSR